MILLMNFIQIFHFYLDKDEESFCFMEQANTKSEWLWKIYFNCSCGLYVAIAIPFIASVIYAWFLHEHFDAAQAFRPFGFMLVKKIITIIGNW